MKVLTKKELTEMAINGEFEDNPQRFIFVKNIDDTGVIVEIFDDGHSPGLLAVEIWHGERLGNECYVNSYSNGIFIQTSDKATN